MQKIQVVKRFTFTGHSGSLYCLAKLGPSGFVSAGSDGQVVTWDLDAPGQGTAILKAESSVYGLHVDGSRLVVGENGKALHLVQPPEVLRSMEIKSPIFAIHQLDGRYLVGTGAGELFVFDPSLNFISRKRLTEKSIRGFARLDNDLAVGSSDNLIRILDATTLEEKHLLTGHTLSVFALAYQPDTHVLVSVGRDAHIRVWDSFRDYAPVQAIPAHNFAINDLKFSPDARFFATASMDKTIKIWDATTFELLKVIDKARHDGHINSVNRLLWINTNVLVSCSDDRSIAVWDIKTE
jgi:WD40 repeat protein